MSYGPKRVIFDFDNTMGIPGCDIDDGLALLFLLGHPELATVIGATTAYGNNLVDTVYANTQLMFGELGLSIPVFRGCQDASHPTSDASEYLARTVAANPGEVSIVATGSLTNLRGAQLIDPGFLHNVREIVLMGGITQTLVFDGIVMDELNFACDPVATELVLSKGRNVSVATGNNCLKAFFAAEEFERRFAPSAENPAGSYLWSKCRYWFRDMSERYHLGGFHCWDVVSAAYLVKPELFDDDVHDVAMSERALSIGYLEPAFSGVPHALVNEPVIRSEQEFVGTVYAAWERALGLLAAEV
ncbi:MAG: nucleoside hydrolase [Coriobacteriia bacterium]|nr:nucleoside hydrolase [Coriobacteriia bacterium]